jgi:hypothetical protein
LNAVSILIFACKRKGNQRDPPQNCRTNKFSGRKKPRL